MAASGGDLKAHAASTTDFYALLDLPPTFTPKELDRAWRKTAFKYHPDKVGAADTAAREKFHLANIAYEIFCDASLRQLYDNAREARVRRRKQEELLQGKRREMKADLERREKAAGGATVVGIKRAREEELDEQERLEREIRRIAEDGKRRRKEREEKLRMEMKREQEEAERRDLEAETAANGPPEINSVTELERSVKVKFARVPLTESLDSASISSLFSVFGAIEHVSVLKDKRERCGPSKEKTLVGRALVVYKSIVGAHAAIDGWAQRGKGEVWASFQEVFWAEGKEPECLATLGDTAKEQSGPKPVVSTLASTPKRNGHGLPNVAETSPAFSTPAANGADLRRVPSFASFSSARNTPKTAVPPVAGSPSLEELTMIRLRNAEKRRLEAERLDRQERGSPS